MTRLFANQRIHVFTDSQDRPTGFKFKGRRYRFAQIVQHWEVDVDWWAETDRVWRAYWAVTTLDGMLCVVARDQQDGSWWLVRVYD